MPDNVWKTNLNIFGTFLQRSFAHWAIKILFKNKLAQFAMGDFESALKLVNINFSQDNLSY